MLIKSIFAAVLTNLGMCRINVGLILMIQMKFTKVIVRL